MAPEVVNVDSFLQIAETLKYGKQLLAEQEQQRAANEARIVQQEAILQAQATEISANRAFLTEQQRELEARQTALEAADAEDAPFDPPINLRGIAGEHQHIYYFREVLEYRVGWLRGWLGLQGVLVDVPRLAWVINQTADVLESLANGLKPPPVAQSKAEEGGDIQPWR